MQKNRARAVILVKYLTKNWHKHWAHLVSNAMDGYFEYE